MHWQPTCPLPSPISGMCCICLPILRICTKDCDVLTHADVVPLLPPPWPSLLLLLTQRRPEFCPPLRHALRLRASPDRGSLSLSLMTSATSPWHTRLRACARTFRELEPDEQSPQGCRGTEGNAHNSTTSASNAHGPFPKLARLWPFCGACVPAASSISTALTQCSIGCALVPRPPRLFSLSWFSGHAFALPRASHVSRTK